MEILILDFETNGLTFHDLEVTQASILRVNAVNFGIMGVYNKYFKVNNLKDSDKITGITKEFLDANAEDFFRDKDYNDIRELLQNQIVVGQNVYYDLMVVDLLSIRHKLPIYSKFPLDLTEQFAVNGQYVSLEYTTKRLLTEEDFKAIEEKTGGKAFHDALYDVYAVYYLIKNNAQFKQRLNNYLNTLPM